MDKHLEIIAQALVRIANELERMNNEGLVVDTLPTIEEN